MILADSLVHSSWISMSSTITMTRGWLVNVFWSCLLWCLLSWAYVEYVSLNFHVDCWSLRKNVLAFFSTCLSWFPIFKVVHHRSRLCHLIIAETCIQSLCTFVFCGLFWLQINSSSFFQFDFVFWQVDTFQCSFLLFESAVWMSQLNV